MARLSFRAIEIVQDTLFSCQIQKMIKYFINFSNLSFEKGNFSPILDAQQHFETT